MHESKVKQTFWSYGFPFLSLEWRGQIFYCHMQLGWGIQAPNIQYPNIQISNHKNFYALRDGVSATCTMKEDSELLEIPKLEKLQKCFVIVVLCFG